MIEVAEEDGKKQGPVIALPFQTTETVNERAQERQRSLEEWKYLKVPQKDYQALRPSRLSELAALQPATMF